MVYNGFDMTTDYLSFDYVYKLDLLDNDFGYDLPPISVCTESNVLFDKQKALNYFDRSEEYSRFESYITQMYDQLLKDINNQIETIENMPRVMFKYLVKDDVFENEQNIDEIIETYKKLIENKDFLILEKNIKLNQFFVSIEKTIIDEINFYEKSSLVFNANELFKCSTNKYLRNDTIVSINECFETKTISPKNFGICYTFYSSIKLNNLTNDNFFGIYINNTKLKKFTINSVNINDNNFYNMYSANNFILYYLSGNPNDYQYHDKFRFVKSEKIGFNIELKLDYIMIKYLSSPYMEDCNYQGE